MTVSYFILSPLNMVRHTLLRFIAVEIPIGDNTGGFAHGDGRHADDRLYIVSSSFPQSHCIAYLDT
jgi:hypothetical protein